LDGVYHLGLPHLALPQTRSPSRGKLARRLDPQDREMLAALLNKLR